MRIIFVIGPAFSGKSIYVKKNFPDATVVNISTFNRIAEVAEDNTELEKIAENAQIYCREDLLNRIRGAKEDEVIVLEHQLLTAASRKFFVDAIKEVTDTPIECVVMSPSDEMIEKMLNKEKALIVFHAYEKGKLELPSIAEGFDVINVVHPIFDPNDMQRN